jgi:hypothetical protein
LGELLRSDYRYDLANDVDHLCRARMGISLVFVGACPAALFRSS